MFQTLTTDQLELTTGGQMAPSTSMNMGINAMSLMDHPQKTLDSVKGFLGIQDCPPNSNYTPAAMNSSGGITPSSCAPAPSSGPSVPISE
jgi:hypothetical protein